MVKVLAATKKRVFDPKGYCWMHGFRVGLSHNSCSCTAKVPGHQDASMRNNPIGSSQLNKYWVMT